MILHHRYDDAGRPVATADDDAPETAALAEFLTEEVRWVDYATLLIERAAEAAAGRAVDSASGNACAVDFAPNQVKITHLHLTERPALTLTTDRFRHAVSVWREFLRQSP
ncbi:MAG: hypothetical protein AB7O80_21270 [Acetobacteraceae bacterium]